MSIPDARKRFNHWSLLLKCEMKKELCKVLEEAPMVEVAEFLEQQPLKVSTELFIALNQDSQASLLGIFDKDKQLIMYNALPRLVFARAFEKMSSDLRADFYLKLNEEQSFQLLPYLSKQVRQDVITLSTYPQEKAGGIMSTDFVTVNHDLTATEALQRVREVAPSKKMMYFLYLVNGEMELVGILDLKDLIMADPAEKVKNLANETVVAVHLYDDRELVANKIDKYGLMALPVLNNRGQLVGIVSYEDAIDVIRAEDTEDMERFMGIISDQPNSNYLHTSSIQHFKQRIVWVAGLLVFSVFSSIVIHGYEDVLRAWPMLALYIPMISDTGGNVGSQAATMVIRALSLGQISLKNWSAIIYKEAKVALMVAACLFILCFFKVVGVTYFFTTFGNFSAISNKVYAKTLVISLAVSIQVVSATLIGATLPLCIQWLGKDPALAASPAITTLVDLSGMMIYLGLAKLLFGILSL